MPASPNPPTNPGRRFVTVSLGCKVNQAEADELARALCRLGWLTAEEGQAADLAVLLTCSVTSTAARQCRQAARRLARAHPGARVVVTGCDVQAAPASYGDEGFQVLGRALLPTPERWAEAVSALPAPPPPPDQGPWCPGALLPGPERARALLKIQDGCDAHCAYCIVPSTRGAPRSLPRDLVLAAWRELIAAGAPEVVLTGIHLGRWGHDFDPPAALHDLVAELLAEPGPRIRLSSLESAELTDQLLSLAAENPRLCPHFHLPLQSGSDRVLAAMGRPYRAADYAERALAAAAALPGVCLGADVLVGLPGEDREAYQETRRLIEELPLAYLHVFPYSPRPGTRAAEMAGRPSPDTARRRAAALRELGRAKQRAFLAAQAGSEMQVVVERPGLGRSANYCLVTLDPSLPRGAIFRVPTGGQVETPHGPALEGGAALPL